MKTNIKNELNLNNKNIWFIDAKSKAQAKKDLKEHLYMSKDILISARCYGSSSTTLKSIQNYISFLTVFIKKPSWSSKDINDYVKLFNNLPRAQLKKDLNKWKDDLLASTKS